MFFDNNFKLERYKELLSFKFVLKSLVILVLSFSLLVGFGVSEIRGESDNLLAIATVSASSNILASSSEQPLKTIEYIKVIDTLQGMGTYYTLHSSLDSSKVKLVLTDLASKNTLLENVKSLGSIDASLIKKVGTYKLSLGYKIGSKYKILDTVDFKVKKNNLGNIGGSLGEEYVYLMADDARFEISGFPEEVEARERFSITVKALKPNGTIDTNFNGTIDFLIEGDIDAVFPVAYEFTELDRGVREFPNLFSLTKAGPIRLVVFNVDDEEEMAEVVIMVTESRNSAESIGKMLIQSPLSGISAVNQIEFVGKVDPGLEVSLYDRDQLLLSEDADSEGEFSFTTSILEDGEYIFTLRTANATSEPINITVTTDGARVENMTFEPEIPRAGDNVNVMIQFSTEVDSSALLINGSRIVLEPFDETGFVFHGIFVAPEEPNIYPVNIDVATKLGIRTELQSVTRLEVVLGAGGQEDDMIPLHVPSQVVGVRAESHDRRIVLSWEPATALAGIVKYRIYYGTNPSDLDGQFVDTNDSSTTWYIPDLENGVKYYFQIFGVDADGNLGDQPSGMISIEPGVNGATTLHDDDLRVDYTSKTGPEMYVLVLISLGAGFLLTRKSRFD